MESVNLDTSNYRLNVVGAVACMITYSHMCGVQSYQTSLFMVMYGNNYDNCNGRPASVTLSDFQSQLSCLKTFLNLSNSCTSENVSYIH